MGFTSLFSLTRCLQQTTSTMKCAWVVATLVLISACTVESRICTRMTLEQVVKSQPYMDQCIGTYEARCGWFSVKMCTFNESVPCVKEMNRTVTIYRVVEDCCPGYHRNNDGKCISDAETAKKSQAAEKTSQGGLDPSDTVDEGFKPARSRSDDEDDDDGLFLGASPGVYAGIICGILFVACIALLVAVHYRKRRLRADKQKILSGEQDSAQKQQMIPMVKTDTQPVST
ncbi:uncharacterized protein [Littorina saxatilis]|uniref:uncharacterized protein isoform X2 n=1 Tax=Littorina saxatilis TaxID=31220 RepID=UPI0038B451CE